MTQPFKSDRSGRHLRDELGGEERHCLSNGRGAKRAHNGDTQDRFIVYIGTNTERRSKEESHLNKDHQLRLTFFYVYK